MSTAGTLTFRGVVGRHRRTRRDLFTTPAALAAEAFRLLVIGLAVYAAPVAVLTAVAWRF